MVVNRRGDPVHGTVVVVAAPPAVAESLLLPQPARSAAARANAPTDRPRLDKTRATIPVSFTDSRLLRVSDTKIRDVPVGTFPTPISAGNQPPLEVEPPLVCKPMSGACLTRRAPQIPGPPP